MAEFREDQLSQTGLKFFNSGYRLLEVIETLITGTGANWTLDYTDDDSVDYEFATTLRTGTQSYTSGTRIFKRTVGGVDYFIKLFNFIVGMPGATILRSYEQLNLPATYYTNITDDTYNPFCHLHFIAFQFGRGARTSAEIGDPGRIIPMFVDAVVDSDVPVEDVFADTERNLLCDYEYHPEYVASSVTDVYVGDSADNLAVWVKTQLPLSTGTKTVVSNGFFVGKLENSYGIAHMAYNPFVTMAEFEEYDDLLTDLGFGGNWLWVATNNGNPTDGYQWVEYPDAYTVDSSGDELLLKNLFQKELFSASATLGGHWMPLATSNAAVPTSLALAGQTGTSGGKMNILFPGFHVMGGHGPGYTISPPWNNVETPHALVSDSTESGKVAFKVGPGVDFRTIFWEPEYREGFDFSSNPIIAREGVSNGDLDLLFGLDRQGQPFDFILGGYTDA